MAPRWIGYSPASADAIEVNPTAPNKKLRTETNFGHVCRHLHAGERPCQRGSVAGTVGLRSCPTARR